MTFDANSVVLWPPYTQIFGIYNQKFQTSSHHVNCGKESMDKVRLNYFIRILTFTFASPIISASFFLLVQNSSLLSVTLTNLSSLLKTYVDNQAL